MENFKLSEYQAAEINRIICDVLNVHLDAISNNSYQPDLKTDLMTMYHRAFTDASLEEADIAAQNVIDAVAVFYHNSDEADYSQVDFEAQLRDVLKNVPEDMRVQVLTAINDYLDEIIAPGSQHSRADSHTGSEELFREVLSKTRNAAVTDELLERIFNPTGSARTPFTSGSSINIDERTFTALEVMAFYIMTKNGAIPELEHANIELIASVLCSDREFNHLIYHKAEGNISNMQYESYKSDLFKMLIVGIVAGLAVIALSFGAAALAAASGATIAAGGLALTAGSLVISEEFLMIFSVFLFEFGSLAIAALTVWKEMLDSEHREKICISDSLEDLVTPGLLDTQPLPLPEPRGRITEPSPTTTESTENNQREKEDGAKQIRNSELGVRN